MTARVPDSERVAERAYSIWEKEGRPHGQDHDHWHRAERELAPPPIDGTPEPAKKPARARKAADAPKAEATTAAVEPAKKPARARKAAAPADAAAAPKRTGAKPAATS